MKFVVLGDLHLAQSSHTRFDRARQQILNLAPDAIICLGDLGSGRESGTRESFEAAREYLASFGVPHFAILGNHDLECLDQFASDREAVQCFCEVFESERPYRTIELGCLMGVLLSSTGFRNNRGYRHEVSIDPEQFDWFRRTLEANRERPTVVFSHAPPLGSHLRVLQNPHLHAGNAWLNQSNQPQGFMNLLDHHPQVRLWFSGHNHLGQQYSNSISSVGHCLFAHTGVIGDSTRDGRHHSRLVTTDDAVDSREPCLQIDTLDHAASQIIADTRYELATNRVERCVPAASQNHEPFFAPLPFDAARKSADPRVLGESLFCTYRDMLVEYDRRLEDPVGVVEDWMGSTRVVIEDDSIWSRRWLGGRRIRANADGYFFQVPARNGRLLNRLRAALMRRIQSQ